MKVSGKFVVTVSDGYEQYHPNGGWRVTRGEGFVVAKSEDHEEWTADLGPVKDRLAGVAPGDRLEASSYTGKTGVTGVILKKVGNHLIVEGTAWGSRLSAFAPKGRVGFYTHTFDVVGLKAHYTGSISQLVGANADHNLILRMDAILHPEDSACADSV